MVIPNEVTAISSCPFWNCAYLTSVTIPNSVTSIGEYAFQNCSGLTSATIGNSVTSIGDHAFEDCSSLTSVTIGNSVTSIGDHAFEDCSSLPSITIPDGVTSIGNNAFTDCSGLTSITIGNSVTSIGGYAFRNCSSLSSVTIGNSVTSIGEQAFSGCKGLTSITIPNSVTSIGQYAFSGTAWYDNQLDGLVYAGKVAYKYKGTMPKNSKIILEEGTLGIATFAFEGCHGLTSISIPNSVTSIRGNAFVFCPSLASIKVNPGNSNYDSRNNCNAIIETASNTLIAGCQNTVIPSNVTSIGDDAFSGCSGLTSITIPNSVTSIGDYGFYYCSGLTSITIPDGVTSIGEYTFSYCSGLTSVTIPNSVTSIGDYGFSGCSGLKSVTVIWEKPLRIGSDVFLYSNYQNATLYVPKGKKASYRNVYQWQYFGNIVEIGEITIGDEGMGTYCCTQTLDFSGTDDIKAYIVSAFKPSTGEVTLTRITDVPANTGIVVKGAAGTYSIPMGPGETIVSNMLRGVTTNTVLNKVEGDYTNYILAKKNGNLGFYAVVDGSTLSAGKAYLPLPTASLPSGARSIKLVFEDGETTGISEASRLNDNGEMTNDNVYDLQGRRVDKPTRGLYIVNGRKVVIK